MAAFRPLTVYAVVTTTIWLPFDCQFVRAIRPFDDLRYESVGSPLVGCCTAASKYIYSMWLRLLHYVTVNLLTFNKCICGRPPRYAPPLSPLCGRRSNVAVVPTLTPAAAWCVNTAVSKATWWPWPLTFWPWKWCLSYMWRGLPLCQF